MVTYPNFAEVFLRETCKGMIYIYYFCILTYFTMDQSRVQEYFDDLKYYYLKEDSDWTDKAKSMRTIAHKFYNEITEQDTTYHLALVEIYKGSQQKIVASLAFQLKNQLIFQNRQETAMTY